MEWSRVERSKEPRLTLRVDQARSSPGMRSRRPRSRAGNCRKQKKVCWPLLWNHSYSFPVFKTWHDYFQSQSSAKISSVIPATSRHLFFRIDSLRLFLGLQCQFDRQKAVSLSHRRFGTIDNVIKQLFTVRQRYVCAINSLDAFLVNQKQMIGTGFPGDVHVLADFDVAFGS